MYVGISLAKPVSWSLHQNISLGASEAVGVDVGGCTSVWFCVDFFK